MSTETLEGNASQLRSRLIENDDVGASSEAEFYTPSESYNLLISAIKKTIPDTTLVNFLKESGNDVTFEEMFSPKFVFGLAYSRLEQILPMGRKNYGKEEKPTEKSQLLKIRIPISENHSEKQGNPTLPIPNMKVQQQPAEDRSELRKDYKIPQLTDKNFNSSESPSSNKSGIISLGKAEQQKSGEIKEVASKPFEKSAVSGNSLILSVQGAGKVETIMPPEKNVCASPQKNVSFKNISPVPIIKEAEIPAKDLPIPSLKEICTPWSVLIGKQTINDAIQQNAGSPSLEMKVLYAEQKPVLYSIPQQTCGMDLNPNRELGLSANKIQSPKQASVLLPEKQNEQSQKASISAVPQQVASQTVQQNIMSPSSEKDFESKEQKPVPLPEKQNEQSQKASISAAPQQVASQTVQQNIMSPSSEKDFESKEQKPVLLPEKQEKQPQKEEICPVPQQSTGQAVQQNIRSPSSEKDFERKEQKPVLLPEKQSKQLQKAFVSAVPQQVVSQTVQQNARSPSSGKDFESKEQKPISLPENQDKQPQKAEICTVPQQAMIHGVHENSVLLKKEKQIQNAEQHAAQLSEKQEVQSQKAVIHSLSTEKILMNVQHNFDSSPTEKQNQRTDQKLVSSFENKDAQNRQTIVNSTLPQTILQNVRQNSQASFKPHVHINEASAKATSTTPIAKESLIPAETVSKAKKLSKKKKNVSMPIEILPPNVFENWGIPSQTPFIAPFPTQSRPFPLYQMPINQQVTNIVFPTHPQNPLPMSKGNLEKSSLKSKETNVSQPSKSDPHSVFPSAFPSDVPIPEVIPFVKLESKK